MTTLCYERFFPGITTACVHVDFVARAVSGATPRFHVVDFPHTADRVLINSLSATVVEKRNRDNVSLYPFTYEHLSGEVEIDVTEVSPAPGSALVFKSTHDCEDLVQHFGSHFGDLVGALKMVVFGAATSGASFFLLSSLFFGNADFAVERETR
jgi:hypothetical protein